MGVEVVEKFQKWNWLVEIDAIRVAGFHTCSEIRMAMETVTIPEGGRRHDHKRPGKASFPPVTLTQGAILDADDYQWMKDTYDPAARKGLAGKNLFRSCDILQLDEAGDEKVVYTLHDAWLKEWAHTGWDGAVSEAATREMIIEYDYFDRNVA